MCFQPDLAVRWLKAAPTSYVVIVPMLMVVIPPIQRFVMRQADCRRAKISCRQKAQPNRNRQFFLNVTQGQRHDDET